jgi:hypothetical protein
MIALVGSAGGNVTPAGVLTLIIPLGLLVVVGAWALVSRRRSR